MTRYFLKFVDGRQLSWYEVGQGQPLVLLHGWSISADAFAEVAPLLSDGYRLLIPDLPGHGESSPAVSDDIPGLSADIIAWLDAVTDVPFALVGWSLGGMISINIASSGSCPVKNLTLIGTTPRFTKSGDWDYGLPATQVRVLARNLKRRYEATLGEFFSLSISGEIITSERLRTIRNFAVRNSQLPDKAVAENLLGQLAAQDQRGALASIECPVLVIHGENDHVSPVDAGRYLATAVPNGRMAEFPGVGHAPFWSQPKKFVDCLREHC